MVELLLQEGAKVDYFGREYKESQRGHKKVRYNTRFKHFNYVGTQFSQLIGSRLSAMHVACIQGRADVVRLLIARAEENMLKKSLKDVLNAKSKVSRR